MRPCSDIDPSFMLRQISLKGTKNMYNNNNNLQIPYILMVKKGNIVRDNVIFFLLISYYTCHRAGIKKK